MNWISLRVCLFVAALFVPLCVDMGVALAWHSIRTGGQCKQSGSSCRTTIGNAGGAGACCDPRQSNLASCATQNDCLGGQPYKWASLPVSWTLNTNNMLGQSGFRSATIASVEKSLKDAWDAWTKPSCTSFTHTYAGRSQTGPSPNDRKLVVFLSDSSTWASRRLPSSVLAVTLPVASGSGQLIDADILFNPLPSGRNWGFLPSVKSNEMDFADVAAHEIGHALGFGHTAPRSSLMYFSVRGVGPLFSGITSDEEGGVCTIYPQKKCTQDSQCGTCRACTNGSCGPKNLTPGPQVCQGCQTDANCSGGACAQVDGRSRCLQACDAAGCCPSGYTCKALSGKQLCVPDANTCPTLRCTSNASCGANETCQGGVCQKSCQQDTDCPAGQVCKSQACVPAEPGKLGQPCSDNIPCVAGTTCETTSKGRICTTSCGVGTGGFGPGSPGSTCTTSCASGFQCVSVLGRQMCGRVCTSNSFCRSVGEGRCGSVSGSQLFCFCQQDGDCGTGFGCNKDALRNYGLGACAKRGGGSCPTGYQCSGNFCVPGAGTTCGNGTCDGQETCTSCAQDCACPQGQSCQSGSCTKPTTAPTCGDGTCAAGQETCGNCPQDCACSSDKICNGASCVTKKDVCGDGACEGAEDCNSCQDDCACPQGLACQSGRCQPLTNCGNGVCDTGEACDSCPQDCPCTNNQICISGNCQSSTAPPDTSTSTDAGPTPLPDTTFPGADPTSQPPVVQPGLPGGACLPNFRCVAGAVCATQPNGSNLCLLAAGAPNPSGCGCQTQRPSPTTGWVFLLLLGGLITWRMRIRARR